MKKLCVWEFFIWTTLTPLFVYLYDLICMYAKSMTCCLKQELITWCKQIRYFYDPYKYDNKTLIRIKSWDSSGWYIFPEQFYTVWAHACYKKCTFGFLNPLLTTQIKKKGAKAQNQIKICEDYIMSYRIQHATWHVA